MLNGRLVPEAEHFGPVRDESLGMDDDETGFSDE
jgi:hypothetical protein